MLIWSGWGLAALLPIPLIPISGGALSSLGVTDLGSMGYALIIAGVAGAFWTRWFDGWRERKSPPRVMVDAQTGQQLTVGRRDSLFWIPMKFLWIPYLLLPAIGVVVLFQSFLGG